MMISKNIISEFESLQDAKYFVQTMPKYHWGMDTIVGIYKTENGDHQNYYLGLFYSSQELNNETEVVLTNNTMGISPPPLKRTLGWIIENHHTTFNLSDLIKEIEEYA